MASSSSSSKSLFRLCLLLSVVSISVAARPCKTLFISSYSFSINPTTTAFDRPNPTFFFRKPRHPSLSSPGFVAIFTEITEINPNKPSSPEILLDRRFFPEPQRERVHSRPALPLGFAASSYDFSSLRERTKDILSVVVALLFGVGCGALTAATMYLAWSIFFSRYDYRNSFEEYGDEEEDFSDDASPKKMGYEKIPAAAPVKEAA